MNWVCAPSGWSAACVWTGALFYLDWTDLQLTQAVQANQSGIEEDRITGPATNVTGNVAKAHSEGAEVSLQVAPFAGATFISAAAWLSALTDVAYTAPDGTVFPPGTRLPGSARFQWSNVVSYGRPLPYFESIGVSFALAHTYLGRYFSNLEGDSAAGGYSTLDANLGLRKNNGWRSSPATNATSRKLGCAW